MDDAINSIEYFWTYKGDLTRWVGWEENKDRFPEVVKAWNDYKTAEKIMDAVVAQLLTLRQPCENNDLEKGS